ncbi:MAG: hypothetical protein O7H41_10440 [Planctomycetota bacterium]|nr:hypothetical protein [Planctomycetota bacterium]
MGREDFEVNSRMMQIFNQYRIDQTSISYRCYGGIVYVEGMIRVEGSGTDGVKASVMDAIHNQIRGMKHVKRVKYDFVNMTHSVGGWIYTKTVKKEEGKTWQVGDKKEDKKEGGETTDKPSESS